MLTSIDDIITDSGVDEVDGSHPNHPLYYAWANVPTPTGAIATTSPTFDRLVDAESWLSTLRTGVSLTLASLGIDGTHA